MKISLKTGLIVLVLVIVAICLLFLLTPSQEQEPAFTYPSDFGLTYVVPVNWPPTLVTLKDTVFSCAASGEEISATGKTETVEIEGAQYCRTVQAEGAAGSVYRQYLYTFQRGEQLLSFAFASRMPQCLNYDSPEKEVCIQEQGGFNPDSVVALMTSTLK
jgi:hypothetical protein